VPTKQRETTVHRLISPLNLVEWLRLCFDRIIINERTSLWKFPYTLIFYTVATAQLFLCKCAQSVSFLPTLSFRDIGFITVCRIELLWGQSRHLMGPMAICLWSQSVKCVLPALERPKIMAVHNITWKLRKGDGCYFIRRFHSSKYFKSLS
jgi:hypothetical protein